MLCVCLFVVSLFQIYSCLIFKNMYGRYYICKYVDLLSVIWNIEKLPQNWKKLIIIPVYRKGEKTDHSNYRDISGLSNSKN